jgi:acid phosphatase family membrane protein YuiD
MSSIVSPRTAAFVSFAENPILLSSLSSWFIAQLVKAVLVALRSPRRTPQVIFSTLMWRTGGMPSSHSSLVAALATSVGLREGIGSNLFIVTLALALIVIRDSLGVRRSSGVQARSLNQLGKEVSERFGIPYHPVKEIQGHAPLEVLVGALLGAFIATAFALL